MKTCTRCGETKPLYEFNPTKQNKSGRTARCRVCSAEVNHARYMANRQQRLADCAAYRQANLEVRRHYNREYAAAHREQSRERHANWRKANAQHVRTQRSRWYYENHERQLAYQAEWRERNRERVNGLKRECYAANDAYRAASRRAECNRRARKRGQFVEEVASRLPGKFVGRSFRGCDYILL
jgi:hypothetical protein